MNVFRLVAVLCIAFVNAGCGYHRTILRVHTVTPPPTIATVPPADPVATALIGTRASTPPIDAATPGAVTPGPVVVNPVNSAILPSQPPSPQVYYKTAEMRTVGKIYNRSRYAVTVHIPSDWELLKFRSPSLTYTDVQALMGNPDNWAHWDLLPLKPGDSENWWIRIPSGRWRVDYDYTINGWSDHRGRVTVDSDFTLADHLCPGAVVDWFVEILSSINDPSYCK